MKQIGKLSLGGVLLFGLLTLGNVTEVQAGPFSNYHECVKGCLNQYENWTWSLSACSADCYIDLIKDILNVFNPFM
jgi:hypothetical protein